MRTPLLNFRTIKKSSLGKFTISFCSLILTLLSQLITIQVTKAQSYNYNLYDLAIQKNIKIEKRTIGKLTDGKTIKISGAEGPGVAWLENIEFTNGTIEIELRGKDIKQGSFLGIALHGDGKNSYEAIYFRPFNFHAKEKIARSHSVQYISMPNYDWEYLRDNHPGKYENEIANSPDPNSLFIAKITVKGKILQVHINNSPKPSLVVQSLHNIEGKKIGLWVGNNSEGEFANFKLTAQ